jgi:general stress protein YciG
MTKSKKSKRGFAAMTPEQRRAISSLGGKAVKPENRMFSRDRVFASAMGRKGGLNTKRRQA